MCDSTVGDETSVLCKSVLCDCTTIYIMVPLWAISTTLYFRFHQAKLVGAVPVARNGRWLF